MWKTCGLYGRMCGIIGALSVSVVWSCLGVLRRVRFLCVRGARFTTLGAVELFDVVIWIGVFTLGDGTGSTVGVGLVTVTLGDV